VPSCNPRRQSRRTESGERLHPRSIQEEGSPAVWRHAGAAAGMVMCWSKSMPPAPTNSTPRSGRESSTGVGRRICCRRSSGSAIRIFPRHHRGGMSGGFARSGRSCCGGSWPIATASYSRHPFMASAYSPRSEGQKSVQDISKYATTGFVRATEDELAALPPKVAALIRALFVPTAETMYVPTCGLNIIYLDTYLNHSPHRASWSGSRQGACLKWIASTRRSRSRVRRDCWHK
jgi:hypothetical protein